MSLDILAPLFGLSVFVYVIVSMIWPIKRSANDGLVSIESAPDNFNFIVTMIVDGQRLQFYGNSTVWHLMPDFSSCSTSWELYLSGVMKKYHYEQSLLPKSKRYPEEPCE